jgi:RNA polymerase sigma-70 factor (ECF subfamily)
VATDAALIEAWRSGDETAARALFDRYFDPLHRFFATKVGDGVRDLIQETMLACIEHKDDIRDPSSFRQYLFGIARRRLFRHWRDGGQHDVDYGLTTVTDISPSPSGLVVENEEQGMLLAAMQRIPVDLQIVLELFYWENFTAPEIAVVQGVPEGTVRTRLRRARQLVRREWERLARRPLPEVRMGELAKSLGESHPPQLPR